MVRAAALVLGLAFSGTLVGGAVSARAQASSAFPSQRLDETHLQPMAAPPVAETPTAVALRFFEALPHGSIDAALRAVRPPRLTTDERARLLATLPEEGELVPDAMERHKLAALEPVLAYHDRDGVLAVKVIDLPHAGLVIYHRAAVLISRPALRLLSASELQAAIAHEIGHEYFWSRYGNTRLAGNPAGQQTLELKCDGIAALTLLELGLDVSRLSAAIRRMIEFNQALGATAHTTGYPTVREREHFVRTLLKTTAGHRKQPASR